MKTTVPQEQDASESPRALEARAADGMQGDPFRPRWGHIAVALLGIAALCGALVTAVLAMIGMVSLLVPLVLAAVTVAAVGTLRALAIRSRRARVDRAFAEAMAPVQFVEPQPVAVAPPLPVRPQRPTVLFDAEETAPRQASPMELRTAALSNAHGSSVVDVRADVSANIGPARSTDWAPVEVPRPTYVVSPKAERQAPAPLDLPEAPKAQTRTPIKAAEAAARRAESGATAESSEPAAGGIDLDNVLQRRRA
jgi:hypothetical protein